jgi:hypothetical protein
MGVGVAVASAIWTMGIYVFSLPRMMPVDAMSRADSRITSAMITCVRFSFLFILFTMILP